MPHLRSYEVQDPDHYDSALKKLTAVFLEFGETKRPLEPLGLLSERTLRRPALMSKLRSPGLHDAAPGTGDNLIPTSGASIHLEASTAKKITFLILFHRNFFDHNSSQRKTGIKKIKTSQ